MKPNRNPAGSEGYPEKQRQAVLEEEKWERMDLWAGLISAGLIQCGVGSGEEDPKLMQTQAQLRAEIAWDHSEALEQERERRRGK